MTLSSGTVSVATFNQTAGTMDLSGTANLTVANAFAVTGGNLNFTGNALSLTQQSGNLVLASGGPAINAGSVALFATNGDVVVDRAVTAAGEVAIGAGSGNSGIGTIGLNAAVSADKVFLSAWGADGAGIGITQKAPITARELIVASSGGRAVLTNGNNKVDALAASGGGLDFVDKVDLLTIQPLTSALAGATVAGLPYTGAVRITNNAASGTAGSGSVVLDGTSTVVAESLAIVAAGDIRADAAISTFGNYDTAIAKLGSVDLQAGGSIRFGSIRTFGGAIGSAGSAGGAVTLAAGTGISGGDIDASGVPSSDGTQGKPGGAITMTSSAGDIVMAGQVRSSGQYAGGQGGNVSISAASGNLVLDGIDTRGGDQGSRRRERQCRLDPAECRGHGDHRLAGSLRRLWVSWPRWLRGPDRGDGGGRHQPQRTDRQQRFVRQPRRSRWPGEPRLGRRQRQRPLWHQQRRRLWRQRCGRQWRKRADLRCRQRHRGWRHRRRRRHRRDLGRPWRSHHGGGRRRRHDVGRMSGEALRAGANAFPGYAVVSTTGGWGDVGAGGSAGAVSISSGGGNVFLLGDVEAYGGGSNAAAGGTGGAVGHHGGRVRGDGLDRQFRGRRRVRCRRQCRRRDGQGRHGPVRRLHLRVRRLRWRRRSGWWSRWQRRRGDAHALER